MTAAEVSSMFNVNLWVQEKPRSDDDDVLSCRDRPRADQERRRMMITDHADVNLNDRINKHCTQGCDCFFVEEELLFFSASDPFVNRNASYDDFSSVCFAHIPV